MTTLADTRPTMPAVRYKDSAVQFDFDMKFEKNMLVNAESFNAWCDRMLPIATTLRPSSNRYHAEGSDDKIDVGSYLFRRRVLPAYDWTTPGFIDMRTKPYWRRTGLHLYKQGKKWGWVEFDGDVNIPTLIDRYHEVWMSLTPMEVMTCRPGVRKAKGDVLMGGLGLGMMARTIREKRGVGRLVVVDTNEHVLETFGKIDGVELIHGDFYDVAKKDGHLYTTILADIWQGVSDASYDDDFQTLKRNHPRVWGWGDYSL